MQLNRGEIYDLVNSRLRMLVEYTTLKPESKGWRVAKEDLRANLARLVALVDEIPEND